MPYITSTTLSLLAICWFNLQKHLLHVGGDEEGALKQHNASPVTIYRLLHTLSFQRTNKSKYSGYYFISLPAVRYKLKASNFQNINKLVVPST